MQPRDTATGSAQTAPAAHGPPGSFPAHLEPSAPVQAASAPNAQPPAAEPYEAASPDQRPALLQAASALRQELEALDDQAHAAQPIPVATQAEATQAESHSAPQSDESSAGISLLSAARRLASLEARLLNLAQQAGRQEPAAAGQAHPVLPALRDWTATAAALHLPTQAAEKLAEDLLADEVQALLSAAPGRTSTLTVQDCLEWLSKATALELELLAQTDDENLLAPIRDLRQQMRAELAARHEAGQVGSDIRDAWANRLIDRCETILTAIDDLPAERGARQLQRVEDNVRWHLQTWENTRARRRQLHAKRRQLLAERQDRLLRSRLERVFGSRCVAGFERLVLCLILLVLGILTAEMLLKLSPSTLFTLRVIDAAACAVFLTDFFVKLALATDRWRWFWRHVLVDFIPSIPFGLLLSYPALDPARAGRLLRLLQLGRAARYVRFLHPALRLLRAYGFLARGLDHLARNAGRLLNRNVILYPTREERQAAQTRQQSLPRQLRRLQSQVNARWRSFLNQAPPDQCAAIFMLRIESWQAARAAGDTRRQARQESAAPLTREIPAETLIRNLAAMAPHDVEYDLGPELTVRLARAIQLFARPPMCYLPIIRRYVPRLTPGMTPAQVVAATARSAAGGLRRHLELWFWFADLYGTVSPSQFIDRIGTVLVKASFRPAYRLALFGSVLLLTKLILEILPTEVLKGLENFLDRFVGSTVLVLGTICIIILGMGWWLKRMAREATEYFERVANAQFLPLTEIIRGRKLLRATTILHQRVLLPEWQLREPTEAAARAAAAGTAAIEPPDAQSVHAPPAEAAPSADVARLELFRRRVRSLLTDAPSAECANSTFDMLDYVAMLYRDSLDGALFCDGDTRTTSQLLGNPVLQQAIELSERVSRKERRSLELLDLERQQSLLGGPYLWFNFISRAISHSVACLLVHYNRRAIPLAEFPLATPQERLDFREWLMSQRTPEVSTRDAVRFLTASFTALHFLDVDPHRDENVLNRFGPEVLARLRRDRALMIRRVFGTYPLHKLPKEQRVLNLYTLYRNWLSGGRAILLPVFMLARSMRFLWRFCGWVRTAIHEIRNPESRVDYSLAAEADFSTAARKIARMRGPVVQALIRLRAMFDAEYLGVPLPGDAPSAATACDGTSTAGQSPPVEADLRFIDAEPALWESLAQDTARAAADMRRLKALLDEGLLPRLAESLGLPPDAFSTREHLRALACAYLSDHRQVRRLLSAREILREVYAAAPAEPPAPPRPLLRRRLRRAFHQYWRLHGFGGKAERRAAWFATVWNTQGVGGALLAWSRHGESARAEGCRILADVLRHPGRITEQLVTLRAVQTLSLLDILDYREHVFELGRYADAGESPGDLLAWP